MAFVALAAVAAPVWAATGRLPAEVAPASAVTCPSRLVDRPLPLWARAGFSPGGQRVPHVTGTKGEILAVLWGWPDPLRSPPSTRWYNKVLWVSKVPDVSGRDLSVKAHLLGSSSLPVQDRRVMGGPGPSVINMPEAGCWQFSLHWGGRSDTLYLDYLPDR